ncbi:MAG: penicillin-binding protein, partial [Candidatus Moranbacteria bacterium]|nr:penicillin-binding protein [Candidatus Moranbacteria bacterium]
MPKEKKFLDKVKAKLKLILTKENLKKFSIFTFKLSIVGFLVGIIFAVGVYAYFSKDLPSPGHISENNMAESTKIFDSSGQVLLYEFHGEERRTIIQLKDVSEHAINATLAAEDDNFYNHHGLDFPGIAKAVWTDVTSGSAARGASTLTQQFIKNSILTPEKTYTRKIKEAILSLELERRFTKDEILEMYLNQIPYGSNAYGIEAAAQTFFEKNANNLSLDEAAMLAALPKAPTRFSPYGNNSERLLIRQEWILKRMEDLGYYPSEEIQAALKEDTLSKVKPFKAEIKAPHFVMYV